MESSVPLRVAHTNKLNPQKATIMNEVQNAFRSWLKDLIKEAVTEVITERMPDLIKESETEQHNPLGRFYTRAEVCEKLSICHATFHNWVNAGKLKSVKIQGRSYIDAVCLDKALAEGIIKTNVNHLTEQK